MNLMDFQKLRSGLQMNAYPGPRHELSAVENSFRGAPRQRCFRGRRGRAHRRPGPPGDRALPVGGTGHHVTLHMVAQKAEIPAQREPLGLASPSLSG